MRKRIALAILIVIPFACLLSAAVYAFPPVHERLAWRVQNLRTQIRHMLNPPEEMVFVPQTTLDAAAVEAIVQATIAALASPTPSLPPALTPTPGKTAAPPPSPTPTIRPTSIPERVVLNGARHEYQQMNNCGPATLAMGLTYWGWQGDQRDTRAVLRPNFSKIDDKNVMPAEMVRFVETRTEWKALTRVGGDVQLLKKFIAAGFPVIIEKGLQPHPRDWMGHYALFNGYDDGQQRFTTQDSYTYPGKDVMVPYASMDGSWWRDFNYVYIVIYPPGREAEVLSILGPQADVAYNYRYAADLARREVAQLEGRDQFFAWYNLGSNLVALQDYAGAAQAYDQAFALYAAIPEEDRPWRMLWYQVGPYEAYYHTGRYADVISLGNQTLNQVGGPILEETFYWLGLAREAQGNLDKAIYDFKKAVEINPDSTPALQELERLGAQD